MTLDLIHQKRLRPRSNMRIRRFNENMKSDNFISIQEVKEVFANLDDHLNNIEISHQWLSGTTEYHVSAEPEETEDKHPEETEDIKVIMITGELPYEDSVPFYEEYGHDSHSISTKDIIKLQNTLSEIVDSSKHIESEGYRVHTQIYNYMFVITISKIGELIL